MRFHRSAWTIAWLRASAEVADVLERCLISASSLARTVWLVKKGTAEKLGSSPSKNAGVDLRQGCCVY